jgi:hypothetical protein
MDVFEVIPYQYYQRIGVAHACSTVLRMAELQQTRMIIFDNMPYNFGGKYVASVLRELRRGGLQIVCILQGATGKQQV